MYHVAIDIGGTFTDCAVIDADGRVACVAKSPTTRADPTRGVLDVLAVVAEQLGLPLEAFLRQTALLIHGCTVATNAMLERAGAPTGLITTRGHEDALLIGKVAQKVAGLSERQIIHQARLSKAHPPLVPPERIVGVRERIDADGEVVAPLVLADVEAAAARLRAQGVTSVAICFLWSFLNDQHERAARDYLARAHPDLHVQLSSQVAPVLGEYERAVTTVLSAYLGPPVLAYLDRLAARLAEQGYDRALLIAHCLGGLTTVDEARERPLLTLDSGPAGGVLGARYFGQLYGEANILCTDMGGTSFDVSLIENGEYTLEEEPVLDKYTFLLPKIAISSIGAGGGSIIWVDPDGLLRVGPQSAGADPGPACYGRGGQQPTVTDANLLLGYLNPAQFVGGRQPLVPALAEAALARVAREAGLDLVAAAAGAFQIVNAQMADLIRRLTVEKGHDPRQFALFAYGGMAPTHVAYYARQLRVKRIYIPRHATVFSALGMLTGGLVHTAEASYPAALPLTAKARAELQALYARLEARIRDQYRREGITRPVQLRRFAYVKYRLQPRALPIALADGPLTEAALDELASRFEARYAAIYGEGAGYRQAGLELVKVRVDGTCAVATPALSAETAPPGRDPSAALQGERPAYFLEAGRYLPTRIYAGDRLRYGNVLTGPCIIERMGDTVVIPPAAVAEVDRYQNLIVHVEAGAHARSAPWTEETHVR
jgi:N-methylhydantoinase A